MVVVVLCTSPVEAYSSKVVVLLSTLVMVSREAIKLSASTVVSFFRLLVLPSFTLLVAAAVVIVLSISLTECSSSLVVASSSTLVKVGGVVPVFLLFPDNLVVVLLDAVLLVEAMIVVGTWPGVENLFIAIVEV